MSNAREASLRGEIDFTRQRGWFDPVAHPNASVTMVGCGGIGSVTAMALAKLGIPNLVLIDGDTVEAHNLPNQMFYLGHKGQTKVDAVSELCQDIGVTEVEEHFGFLRESGIEGQDSVPGYKPRGIVVSGLDSMEARQEVWKTVRYNVNVPFYIDARLGGQSVVLYTVDPRKPDECRRYEETLHSSDESVEAPCTMRSIIDVGFIVSSLIVRSVRRHLAGDPPEHTVFWNHATLNASVGR